MDRRCTAPLLAPGAIRGSSHLVITIGVRDLPPAALIEVRLLLAAPILVGFARRCHGARALVAGWRPGVVLGVPNAPG